jgi:hypothetical protein
MVDQQLEPLWSRFGTECQQFAEGFNYEMGSRQLHVECGPDTVLARFSITGAEVFLQLDKTQRHIECVMSSGCTNYGSCIVEHPAVMLAIPDGQLRFVFGGTMVSEEELAVKLLTELVEFESPASA